MRKLLIFISLFLTISLSGQVLPGVLTSQGVRRVYYVSKSGNDANTGLSDAQAWQTLSKVSGITFRPGDIVKFKCGDTWRETLHPKGSGTSGNPVTFSSYGAGSNPILTGANVVTGFADTGSNQWDATVTTQPTVVMFGVTRGTLVANKAAIIAEYQWYWTGNVLSVYATSDPSGTIEGGYRNNVINQNTNEPSNITFRNLTIQNGNQAGDYMIKLRTTTLSGIKFYDCTIRNGGGEGFNIIGTTKIENCVIDGCDIYGNWRNGIFVDPAVTADVDAGLIINDCNIYTNGLQTSSEYNGIFGNLRGVVISNCDIYDNGRWNILSHGIYQYLTSGVVTITNCTIHDQPAGSGVRLRGSGIVTNCAIYGNSDCGFNLNTNTTYNVVYTLERNIVYDNGKWGVMKGAVGTGTVDLIMYFNTILNDTGTEAALTIAVAINSLTVKNNIFSTNNDYCFEVQGTQVVFDIDYNCYYRIDAGNRFKWDNAVHTLLEWQGHGLDVNGVFDNPDLVNVTHGSYDFHLQAASPCKTTGVTIPGLPLFDYEGNAVSPTTPSIGAYEYH